jgi:ketosteroid isomerase-like protein
MTQIPLDEWVSIQQLIARYGHVLDAAVRDEEWSRLEEIFTSDIVFDARPAGYGLMSGIDVVRNAWSTGRVRHPRAHHATNVVIETLDGDTATATSKGISVFLDDSGTGQVSSVVYRDVLRREGAGWRIARREAHRLLLANEGASENSAV